MAHLEDAGRRSPEELVDTRVREVKRLAWSYVSWWAPSLIVAMAFVLWEWSVRSGRLSSLFFPAPSTIALTIVRLFANGRLTANAGATLSRVGLGLVLGGMPGLLVGLAMGWSRPLRLVIDPLVAATHPLPKIAILPLIMIIFGIGEFSKILSVAIGVFFTILLNTMAGVRGISPIYFEVAESYGASPWKVFTRVIGPGSLPLVLTGTRLALNLAFVLTIAVELVAANEGLGDMIWFAWQTMRTEELYASLTAIAALGVGLNLLLQGLISRLVPWHVERET